MTKLWMTPQGPSKPWPWWGGTAINLVWANLGSFSLQVERDATTNEVKALGHATEKGIVSILHGLGKFGFDAGFQLQVLLLTIKQNK